MYDVDQSDIRNLHEEIAMLKIRVRRIETATVKVRVSPTFSDYMGYQFPPFTSHPGHAFGPAPTPVDPWVDG